MPQWTAAMMAKFYGVGKPIGKEELDRLTGDYDVVSLVPSLTSLDADTLAVCSRHTVLFLRRGVLRRLSRRQSDCKLSRLRQLVPINDKNGICGDSMAFLAGASVY